MADRTPYLLTLMLALFAGAAHGFSGISPSRCMPLRVEATHRNAWSSSFAPLSTPWSSRGGASRSRSGGGTSSSLRMVDTNVIIGVGIGVLGLAGGVGLVAFADGQAERFEERGSAAMSEETKSKLAAQFMEDVEMQAVGLDDTISKMEAAMAKRQGIDVEELEKDITITEKLDDGW